MIHYTFHRPKLTSYQLAILNSEKRFTVTEAATKVGKTASHIVWLFEQALKCKPNQSVWWVAPVYSQALIAYNRMRVQISDKSLFKANETKLTITLFNGAHIQFKSAEKPDNLYGDDVYSAVFDEFTRAREEAWFALRSTLTKTKGKCKFIGNVKGKKNWGYKMAQNAKGGMADYGYFKITAWDAVKEGILEEQEILDAQRDLPERVFKELYLADPSEDGSNPFGFDFIKLCTRPMSTLPAVAYGIDLAKSYDWTVIIGMDKMASVSYFERFQADWSQTRGRIARIVNNTPSLIDSTGVGDPIFEDLSKLCRRMEGFKYDSNSKQQLMEGLSSDIQNGRIGFPEGIITDELGNFEFQHTRTGVRYTAPEGFHDDAVNALALCAKKHKEAVRQGKYVII